MGYANQILPPPSILKNVQILVVDNDADSRYLYKTLFEIYGAQVTTTESIADAVTALGQFTPDILICEIRFFGEDPTTLVQNSRMAALNCDRTIPILVISAYCAARFAPDLLAMAEAYLFKPIDIDYLVDEVWNLVHLAKSPRNIPIQAWVAHHRVWTKRDDSLINTAENHPIEAV